jgi:hypothetical protein
MDIFTKDVISITVIYANDYKNYEEKGLKADQIDRIGFEENK